MEEITARFVEIELDCEEGKLLYKVITYYKDGRVDQSRKELGGGYEEDEIRGILKTLEGRVLELEVAHAIDTEANYQIRREQIG